MIRAVPVSNDVPFGYEEILMVFAGQEGKSNTQMCIIASQPILNALRSKPMADRMRVIKKLLEGIEQVLLEYSSNPSDNVIKIDHC
jgi:hypothetical protein